MFADVKTNYMFSSEDTPRTDSEKARRALEAVQEAVRVTQVFGTPNIANSMSSETSVVHAVATYFSDPKFEEFFIRREYEIPIGNATYRADIVLCDAEGKFAAIAECKLPEGSNYGTEPLKSCLEAAPAPFGIFASDIGRNSWRFYENLPHDQFRQIERPDFEKGILEFQKIRDDEGELT